MDASSSCITSSIRASPETPSTAASFARTRMPSSSATRTSRFARRSTGGCSSIRVTQANRVLICPAAWPSSIATRTASGRSSVNFDFVNNPPGMKRAIPATDQKALQINLDPGKYGTFAEIGAGQEVARWFFRVGGASGSIAKTISAYDMDVSDAIYGPCERYVSRQRLQSMLDHEYTLLLERLGAKRGAATKFFVFANTVAARSYSRHDEAHGWMGARFNTEPKSESSEIIIHVRMLDQENLQEQEALGIIGVNLIYGALHYFQEPETLVASLLDNLNRDRIEVDMIKFAGPAFSGVDNRLMALQLVTQGLTDAAMFTAGGEVVQAAEVL